MLTAMEHTRIPKDRTRSNTPAMPTPMADSPSQTAVTLIWKKAAALDASAPRTAATPNTPRMAILPFSLPNFN